MQQETTRVIKLIDEYGNQRFVHQQGRMSITKHNLVLSALEKRALRYRRKGQKQVDMDEILYEKAMDETGTVSTVELNKLDTENFKQMQRNIQNGWKSVASRMRF